MLICQLSYPTYETYFKQAVKNVYIKLESLHVGVGQGASNWLES